MSTDAVTPLRHRMIEDMNARKLSAGAQRGQFTVASGLLGFSTAPLTRRRLRISGASSCTWPRPV